MKILKITIQNINSLRGQFELDFSSEPFTQTGLFAITGDTGAGKTSILDALTLALYGKTARTHEKEVMTWGTTESLAEVEFSAQNQLYRAKWVFSKNKKTPHREIARRNSKGEFELLATGKTKLDGTKDEKGIIEQVCGLNFEQFRRSVMLAQGDFATFLRADDKDRSALLERLTSTEIYTKLSKAAHQRAKIEQQHLQDLQKEISLLNILEPDAHTSFVEQLQALVQKAGEQQQLIAQNRHQIDLLKKHAALCDRLSELKIQQQKIDEKKEAFQPDLQRLEQHRRTLPFAQQIARWRDGRLQIDILEKEIEQLSQKLAEQTEQANTQKVNLDTKIEQKKNAAENFRTQTKIYESVIRLDENIKTQNTHFQQLNAEKQQLSQQQQQAEETLNIFKNKLETTQTILETATQWLANHLQGKFLVADVPIIENYLQHLRNYYRTLQPLRASIEKNKAELAALEGTLQHLQEKNNSLHAHWQAQKDALAHCLAAESLPADPFEAEKILDKKTEQIAAQLLSLEDFEKHSSQYREVLNNLENLKNEQENLQTESFWVEKEILTALDLLQNFEEKTSLKRQRFEREQSILNFERERSLLQHGEPCPLCGALEHPFLLHGAAHFVDDARLEWEAAQQEIEALRTRYAKLDIRHKQLQLRLGETKIEFDSVIFQQTEALLQRIHESEAKIEQLLPSIPPELSENAADGRLRQHIEQLQREISQLRTLREIVQNLDRDCRASEKNWMSVQNELQIATKQFDSIQGSLKLDEQQLAISEQDFQNEKRGLDSVLEKYNLVFHEDSIAAQFKNLQKMQLQWEEFSAQKTELTEKLNILRKDFEIQEHQFAQITQALEEKNIAETTARSTLEQLKKERWALFQDQSVAAHQLALQNELDTLETHIAHATTTLQNVREIVHLTQGQLENSREKLSQITENQRIEIEGITAKLAAAGFQSIENLMTVILPDNQVEAIETAWEQLKMEATQCTQSQKDAQKELDQTARNLPAEADLATLERTLQQAEQNFAADQQAIGGIKRRLEDNEQQKQNSAALLQKLTLQKRELSRWTRLNELIGSFDGSNFRKFAQSLTLEQLIYFANQHLQQLNGRYLLQRKATEGEKFLEIEMVDTYQANNLRSTNTLSGGESFLVSLALALGLGDLAGQKTQVQSLFIDEGFGALDENALEIAISTLENLQSRGATIGIISHLRELKERIGVQIFINKGTDGFSKLVVRG